MPPLTVTRPPKVLARALASNVPVLFVNVLVAVRPFVVTWSVPAPV